MSPFLFFKIGTTIVVINCWRRKPCFTIVCRTVAIRTMWYMLEMLGHQAIISRRFIVRKLFDGTFRIVNHGISGIKIIPNIGQNIRLVISIIHWIEQLLIMIMPHIGNILGHSLIFYSVTVNHVAGVIFLDFFQKHLILPPASFDANASARKVFSFLSTWFWAYLNLARDFFTSSWTTPSEACYNCNKENMLREILCMVPQGNHSSQAQEKQSISVALEYKPCQLLTGSALCAHTIHSNN